jgi:2-amino-4-hydroxy-6-hydroxymethyldihydropteridine diphosphokinase
MVRAFVSIGSNIDPETNVAKAFSRLRESVAVSGISTVYITKPEDRPGQPDFYNCVAEISTDLQPLALKQQVLERIERELGRARTSDRSAARTIDLDLILYDELVANTDGLAIPDPDIATRAFLAIPLYELAPDLVLPGSGRRIAELAAGFPRDAMQPLHHYTDRIRKELLHERKE